jgi:hypothetical protein
MLLSLKISMNGMFKVLNLKKLKNGTLKVAELRNF